MQTVIKETVEDLAAKARKELDKAKASKTLGFLIRTPLYGTKEAGKIGRDVVQVWPNMVADPDGTVRRMEGGSVTMVDCEGYTDNRDWAEAIAREWHYTVIEVKQDKSFQKLAIQRQLAAIVDGAGEDHEED